LRTSFYEIMWHFDLYGYHRAFYAFKTQNNQIWISKPLYDTEKLLLAYGGQTRFVMRPSPYAFVLSTRWEKKELKKRLLEISRPKPGSKCLRPVLINIAPSFCQAFAKPLPSFCHSSLITKVLHSHVMEFLSYYTISDKLSLLYRYLLLFAFVFISFYVLIV
jgi:hypothetical protein